ncbi:MAG TPA: hypothetical protein ACFYD6_04780 [Candidatus Brocadiia bacterium]|nr:hypothetical protein [Planctomycetota bacterium]MDO8093873.1 hypothetical protein [Candidatus Brocadiales bacterium]
MKRLSVLSTMVILLGLLVFGGWAIAAPSVPHLNWGSEVNPGQCSDGQLVINVTHKVTNDADSSVTGKYWAYDNYKRLIQVWQVGTDTFCAVIRYQGAFTTVATNSPENTDGDGIAAGIKGTFEGGYRATITGTLDPSPSYRTRGNIGTFDYGWDGNPDNGPSSPFSWVSTYFTSVDSFTYEWWGWVYHGGSNGTWVNSVDGNQGDITD